jgi:hypothetical protein
MASVIKVIIENMANTAIKNLSNARAKTIRGLETLRSCCTKFY